jgi:hypothetical protein
LGVVPFGKNSATPLPHCFPGVGSGPPPPARGERRRKQNGRGGAEEVRRPPGVSVMRPYTRNRRDADYQPAPLVESRLLAAESKQRPINSQCLASEFVIDETRLLEPIHEKANARPRGAYHFCERLMTYFRNRDSGRSMSIIVGEPQENMSQPFLTQIATLVG